MVALWLCICFVSLSWRFVFTSAFTTFRNFVWSLHLETINAPIICVKKTWGSERLNDIHRVPWLVNNRHVSTVLYFYELSTLFMSNTVAIKFMNCVIMASWFFKMSLMTSFGEFYIVVTISQSTADQSITPPASILTPYQCLISVWMQV